VIWASVNCCRRITHAFPVSLRPADQPIQARKSIRVVRLRPKVRQTAALLMPLYRGAPSGPAKENRDGFPPLRGRARYRSQGRLSSWFVRLCVKSGHFVISGLCSARADKRLRTISRTAYMTLADNRALGRFLCNSVLCNSCVIRHRKPENGKDGSG
jgi:hypothetical protein